MYSWYISLNVATIVPDSSSWNENNLLEILQNRFFKANLVTADLKLLFENFSMSSL